MRIRKAGFEDLQEILDLQYLAYQSEAKLFNNRNIPPLTQTYVKFKEQDIGNDLRFVFLYKTADDSMLQT